MTFTADSDLINSVHVAENREPRRGGVHPSLLILHYTGMSSAEKAIDWQEQKATAVINGERSSFAVRFVTPGMTWQGAVTTKFPVPVDPKYVSGGAGAGSGGVDRIGGRGIDNVLALARRTGASTDPIARQELTRLYSEERIRDWTNQRVRAGVKAGRSPGPESSVGKVHQGGLNQRVQLAAVAALGAHAMAWEGDELSPEVRGMLRSRANTIEGGTTEVNKNILGERVLGLPREPDPFAGVAWRDVPRS